MKIVKNHLFLAWLISVAALVGSLFYSDVLDLVPCNLCWYQRIFMYPLALILGVGIWRQDKNLPFYALPLTLLGSFVALYHYLLQLGVVGGTGVCGISASCTDRVIDYFGFITIPLMSLVAFLAMSILIWLGSRGQK